MTVSVQNYLSVSVPSMNQATEIADRSNGELVLYKILSINGEQMQAEEIARATLENILIYEGGKNQSIVLDGYKTMIKTPKETFLTDVVYRRMSGGAIAAVRTAIPDTYLEPGDTAIDGFNEFEVTAVTVVVGENYSQMDIEA